jgi:hypothetical protein
MAVVFWFKVPDPETGEMVEQPMKATEAAIHALGGEKVLGSAEEVADEAVYGDGYYDSPYATAGHIND